MPENADSWKCNKVVDQGKVAKYARCKLVCQDGYDLSRSKKLRFQKNSMIKAKDGISIDPKRLENENLASQTHFFVEKLRIAMNQIQSFKIAIVLTS